MITPGLNVIENKLSAVQKYLTILERYKNLDIREIENDIDKKGALERYLYLVAQAAIDLAESVVAHRKYRKPTTMSDAFYILNEENIISVELTDKMVKMTGFRNVVARDYEKIDYEIVKNVLD